jgi:predicted transcriptional regulator of viral defense system
MAQQSILEELIARHGMVVTTQQVLDLLSFETQESKYRFVSQLAAAGWLVRIKQGLYQIADVGTLGALTLSRFAIAHLLLADSYVSFHAALQFHGLFDQGLKTVSCVALRQKSAVELQGTTYSFLKTTRDHYTGFDTHVFDGQRVQIAQAEKAMVDLMHFHRTSSTVDLVLEMLRDNHHRLDLQRLRLFALSTPIAVRRSLGFLLDGLGLDATAFHAATHRSSSVSKLTPESQVYNGTWRLYYEPFIARELAYAS